MINLSDLVPAYGRWHTVHLHTRDGGLVSATVDTNNRRQRRAPDPMLTAHMLTRLNPTPNTTAQRFERWASLQGSPK